MGGTAVESLNNSTNLKGLLRIVVAVIVPIALHLGLSWWFNHLNSVAYRLNVEKCGFLCKFRYGDDTMGEYTDFPTQTCTCLVEITGFQRVKE